jgi:hypothetical protein
MTKLIKGLGLGAEKQNGPGVEAILNVAVVVNISAVAK